MTRYRAAIIGTGAVANYHIQALKEMKEQFSGVSFSRQSLICTSVRTTYHERDP